MVTRTLFPAIWARTVAVLVTLCACVPTIAQPSAGIASGTSVASANETTVRSFVAAFNAKDVEAMTKLTTLDVEWLSIDGKTVSADAQSKAALAKSMASYFKSCPSCESKLETMMSSPQRVAAVELATWQGKSGARAQRSLSVYEFSGGLIRRVYYFPAEK